jgi:hypothetical protein
MRADREVISPLSRLTQFGSAAVARLMLANAGLRLLMCGWGVRRLSHKHAPALMSVVSDRQ